MNSGGAICTIKGILTFEQGASFTSNKANSFVMFGDVNLTENHGKAYACNLMYSGNHKEIFGACSHGKMHLVAGINPDFFEWNLEPGEAFTSPEAVIS